MKFAYKNFPLISEKLFWDYEIVKVELYPISDEEYNDCLKTLEEYSVDDKMLWDLHKIYANCKRLVKRKVRENKKLAKTGHNKIYDETLIKECVKAYKQFQVENEKNYKKWQANRWVGENMEVIVGDDLNNCEFENIEEAYKKYYEMQKEIINQRKAIDEEELRMTKHYNSWKCA